jgi:esterase
MPFQLFTQTVGADDADSTALFLHGALGSGQNFRSFVARLAKLRPDYRFILADLRHHGKSGGAPPPDTLEACAEDVLALMSRAPVSVLFGHSFGGKVAIEVARKLEGTETEETHAGGTHTELSQVWVLDSSPGNRDADEGSEIRRVVQAVEGVPVPLPRRADVVPLLRAQGLSEGLASWMTTNLDRREDGFVWTFDLERIKTLLRDYDSRDLWPYIEARASSSIDLRFVVAERSERLDAPIRERLQRLAAEGRLHYELLPNAGHWLHVDNPEGLLELIAKALPS